MNVLSGEALESSVMSEAYGDALVPLQLETVEKFRGNLTVTFAGNEVGAREEVDQYIDEWRLNEGTYIVSFEQELIDTYPDYFPIILPSSNAMGVGVACQTRLVTNDDLWTLLHLSKSAYIKDDAVVGILILFDTSGSDWTKEELRRLQAIQAQSDPSAGNA